MADIGQKLLVNSQIAVKTKLRIDGIAWFARSENTISLMVNNLNK